MEARAAADTAEEARVAASQAADKAAVAKQASEVAAAEAEKFCNAETLAPDATVGGVLFVWWDISVVCVKACLARGVK